MIEAWKIQKALYDIYGQGAVCVANAHMFRTGLEADFACVTKAGYGYEYEIKRSYADFKNDFKKGTKHEDIAKGLGLQNYFTFCFSTHGLAQKCLPEVPALYGVMYAEERVRRYYTTTEEYYANRHAAITTVAHLRGATKLHDNKMDWKHVAFRVGMSYKSKVFTRLKWPDAPPPDKPEWRKMHFNPADLEKGA